MKNIILLFTIVWLSSCSISNNKNTENSTPPKSSPKTEKAAPSLSGVYEHFDDLAPIFNYKNDTTYVINFWATWCKPCIEELPYFEELNKVYSDKKVKVILVSLDAKKHIETKLKPFIQKEKLMSHVVVLTDTDANTWIDKVNTEWDGAIPVTIIYNAEEYQMVFDAFENYEELNSIIKSFIKI